MRPQIEIALIGKIYRFYIIDQFYLNIVFAHSNSFLQQGIHTVLRVNMQGENNPNCLLSDSEVIAIRELFDMGLTIAKIARKFKVSRANIYKIVRKQSWTHIYKGGNKCQN